MVKKAKKVEEATTLKLDADLRRRLIALAGCADNGKRRPSLAVIHFEGERAVATDSYGLGLLPIPEGPTPARALAAAELAAILRDVKKGDEARIEFGEDEATVVVVTDGLFGASTRTVTLPYATGEFPNFEQLIPDGEKAKPTEDYFNHRLVGRIAALGASNGRTVVRLRAVEPLKPARVETIDGELLGIVMPVNV